MHEGERRGRGKGVAARVGAAEIAAMGKGSAQEGRPPSHRNAPSGHSGVPVGLFSQRVHSTLCSKTLDLQVRCAHPTGVFAPKRPFGTFRCCAWLILRFRTIVHADAGVPLGLFGKPKRSSFSRVRGLHQATPWLDLQNAHASGSLRSPCGGLRTGTSLRNVPVLCMAYLNKRATCALLFKTLMLQVRCAHPTPSHRNAPSGHSGVPVGLFYAKSTQYSLLQNARPSGSLRSPYGYRGVEDPSSSVHCGCRNVREGDAAENGEEERRKVVEIMTCL